MSQLDIKIRKLQDNGSTFRANIETLYLGGVRSAKVDRLHFEVPEEWKACTISLHVKRLSGTLPDPQILDENNSALVDRRWTLEKEGTWMLLAINDSGYIAMTKPGKYTCYDTIDTDTTTENITPSIYEQFVAEVKKYAKQALESMNAAKTSETNAKTSETNAKASADKAKASADSMDASVATCTTKAGEAEASAAGAKTSETNAKTSETNAKASENAAKTSETNAKASEDAAALSETHAAASEKNAKTSETAAKRALQDTETEHTTALQNIAQARTAALNDVAASTKTATAAANTATQQATDAAGSASTAATKAGEASTSAGAAATSRQAAEKAQKAAEDAAALAGTRAGTDKTLSVPDAPADAKTVGDKFKSIKTDWNSVTDKPSSYPPSAHNHDASAIVSGTLPIARGGTGQTTARSACETLLWRDELSGAPNWDTLDTGIWRTTPEHWGTNGPSGVYTYGIVMVWNYAGNVTQVYIAHRTGEMAFRQRWDNGNSFSGWARVNTNTITSQTSDPGAGSSLATGTILLVYA